MLVIENLSKLYSGPEGAVQALHDVSLGVQGGEFVAVQGHSGCGKTTLLLATGGLLVPDGGRIRIDGEDIYRLSPEQRATFRAHNIGFVFQQFHLVPYLSVLDNVLAPSLGVRSRDAGDRARELVRRLGLESRAHHVPAQLSTGEKQRAAMARALLNKPRVLLADEPTGNLDKENSTVVLDHMREFADRGGAVLLVTHDPIAASYAGRIIRLEEGKTVEVDAA